jgi:hypothetical protein
MARDNKTPRSYRERARACERLAALATDVETRDTMAYLAELWQAMADQDETEQPAHTVPATPLVASK